MRVFNLAISSLILLYPCLAISQTNSGGIHSKRSPHLLITSQNITLNPDQVKIVYSFANTADHDITETFVFSLPSKTEENHKQFALSINQQPQAYKIMQRAVSTSGHDISTQLKAWGLPYNPVAAMHTLDASENRASITSKLHASNLIDKREEVPTWIVKTYYYCEYTFPPHSTTVIEQTYKPLITTDNIKFNNFTALLKIPIKLAKQAINLATPWIAKDNTLANSLQDQLEKYYPQIKNYCLSPADYQVLASAYKSSNSKISQIEMKALDFSADTDELWASAINNFSLTIESTDSLYPVLCWHDQFKRTKNNSVYFSAENYVPLQDIKVMFIAKD